MRGEADIDGVHEQIRAITETDFDVLIFQRNPREAADIRHGDALAGAGFAAACVKRRMGGAERSQAMIRITRLKMYFLLLLSKQQRGVCAPVERQAAIRIAQHLSGCVPFDGRSYAAEIQRCARASGNLVPEFAPPCAVVRHIRVVSGGIYQPRVMRALEMYVAGRLVKIGHVAGRGEMGKPHARTERRCAAMAEKTQAHILAGIEINDEMRF